jgi:hypothetical protein
VPSAVDAGQDVRIWTHGTVFTWHAVRISSDSISGIPSDLSIGCSSCRMSLPRSEVDSILLHNSDLVRLDQNLKYAILFVGLIVAIGVRAL